MATEERQPLNENHDNCRDPSQSKPPVASLEVPVHNEGCHGEPRTESAGDHGHQASERLHSPGMPGGTALLWPGSHGYMKDHKPQSPDLMDKILKGTLRELRTIADEMNIGYPPKLGWLYRQGSEETQVTFGKHTGKTFSHVAQTDLQYLQWAVKETQNHPRAGWQLVQMATWAVLAGLVDNPYDNSMSGKRSDPAETDSTTLESIPEIYHNLPEASPTESEGGTQKGSQKSASASSTNAELILTLRALKDEVRALKEQGQEDASTAEKSRKQ